MATLRLSNLGDGYVQWTISGLSNNFTTANGYISAGITMYQFTQSKPQISGIVSDVYAGSSGTKTVTGTEYVGAGRYQYWGYTEGDGMYYPAGTASVTITEGPDKPSDWSWWSDVRAGQPVAFTVAEFQAFYDRIDAFRVYKFGAGHEWPAFKPVEKGKPITADIVNEARAAIAPMTAATMPPTVYPGVTPVSGDYLNKLKDYLNSVI